MFYSFLLDTDAMASSWLIWKSRDMIMQKNEVRRARLEIVPVGLWHVVTVDKKPNHICAFDQKVKIKPETWYAKILNKIKPARLQPTRKSRHIYNI